MARDARVRREPVLRGAEALSTRAADSGPLSGTEPALRDVLVTTTPSLDGRPIQAYFGLVVGEVVVSAEVLDAAPPKKGFFARIRGNGSTDEQASLANARDKALRELKGRAASRGADAVVGVAVDMQVVGELLVVTTSGTAVRLSEARKP